MLKYLPNDGITDAHSNPAIAGEEISKMKGIPQIVIFAHYAFLADLQS